MKRFIVVVAGIALLAGAGTADAKSSKSSKKQSQGMASRNVQLNNGAPGMYGGYGGYHANGNFRYGPQIDYPQSPPGGAP